MNPLPWLSELLAREPFGAIVLVESDREDAEPEQKL
jgi:hypothetical protein